MSAYKKLSFRLTGVSALLCHSGQLVDPLNSHSRAIAEITKKRKKTEADHLEMGKREWFGCLYIDDDGSPCLPAEMIEAALVKGAMREKRGPAAKAGLFVEKNAALEYDGPRDPVKLWEVEAFRFRVAAKVGMGKVMRTRPRFNEWATTVAVSYLPSLLDAKDIHAFLVTAGEQIGLGDWRPRFGRFAVS